MDGGKIIRWDQRFTIAPDVTGSFSGTSGSGRYQVEASLETEYVFNIAMLLPGLSFAYASVKDPSVSDWWTLDLDIPDLGIVGASYGGASWEPGQACILEFLDLHVYETTLGLQRLTCATVNVYVDGSLVDTFDTSGYTLTSTGMGPSYGPIFGGWTLFQASAQAGVVGASGDFTATSTVSGSVVGGWSFREYGASTWRTLPAARMAPIVPDCDSHCQLGCLTITPIVTIGNTGSATIQVLSQTISSLVSSPVTIEEDGLSAAYGSIWIIPDLDKAAQRMAGDYAAMVQRGGTPKTTYLGARGCYNGEPLGGPGDPFPGLDATTSGEVHPRLTDFLAFVGDGRHIIEDPLYFRSWCPYVAHNEQSYFKYVGGIALEQHSEAVNFSFPETVDDSSDNPQLWAYIDHLDSIVRYFSFICCPHWSYRYFPWAADISGSSAPWDDYWAKIRTQHSSQPSLPSGELRNTRTSLASAPLLEGGNVGFVDTFLGGGKTSWWGNPRLRKDDVNPSAYIDLDSGSSPAWSSPDSTATFSFGSDIVIDPSADPCTVELDLGRWDCPPYLYPLIADRIRLTWSGTNVDHLRVDLVGIDDEAETITDNVQGTFDIPVAGTAVSYAGTWGQDFGAGYLSDTGTDFTGDGISASVCSDPETLSSFEELPVRAGAKLRFTIEPTSIASNVTLHYPRFYAPAANSAVVQETGLSAAVIWPDGPMLRWGQVSFWDYFLDSFASNPPTISGQNTCATVLDWLCLKRVALQAKSATDGLDTEWAGIFETVEANSRKDLAYETLAYVLPHETGLRAILVNTYCPPPYAHWPWADPISVSRTSQYNQRVYTHAKEPRDYVSAPQALRVIDPGDSSEWTGASPLVVSGWNITRHNHATDGSEGAFDIYAGADKIAEARPWQSYSASLLNPPEVEADDISYDLSVSQRHYRAFLSGGTVWVGKADNAFTGGWTDWDTGITASSVCIRAVKVLKVSNLILLTEESAVIKQRASIDEGATWSMATTLFASGKGPTAYVLLSGLIYAYATSGTAVKVVIQDAELNVVVSSTTITGVTVDTDSRVGVVVHTTESGKQQIVLLARVSGAIVQYVSSDGLAFT